MANNTGNKIGIEITVVISGVPTAYAIPFDSTAEDIVEITGISLTYAQSLLDNNTIEQDASCLPTCLTGLIANEYPSEGVLNINIGESLHGYLIDVKTCITGIKY